MVVSFLFLEYCLPNVCSFLDLVCFRWRCLMDSRMREAARFIIGQRGDSRSAVIRGGVCLAALLDRGHCQWAANPGGAWNGLRWWKVSGVGKIRLCAPRCFLPRNESSAFLFQSSIPFLCLLFLYDMSCRANHSRNDKESHAIRWINSKLTNCSCSRAINI